MNLKNNVELGVKFGKKAIFEFYNLFFKNSLKTKFCKSVFITLFLNICSIICENLGMFLLLEK